MKFTAYLKEKGLTNYINTDKKLFAMLKKAGIDPEKELKKGKSQRQIMKAFMKKK